MSPVASPTQSPVAEQSCIANKLKLESTTDNALHLFEVEIYAGGSNVAKNKDATQSSVFKGDNRKFGSSNGVDGDLSSFFHTKAGIGEYYEVDLGASFDVESLILKNRGCAKNADCLCRLSHAQVNLYDGSNNIIWTKQLGDTCGEENITDQVAGCV